MALKRRTNGTYDVKTKAQAVEALELSQELAQAISELEEEHGIKEMRMDSTELHKAATNYMASKKIKALEIPKAGKVAKLIQAFSGRWIGTKDDLLGDSPASAKTLRGLLGKDTWMEISRRVVDSDKLNAAINAGTIDEDEIQDAYIQIPNKPYVRLFEDG